MGERLRERREAAGLSAGQVEEYENIGRQYLSKLELGTNRPPTWGLLARLARRYRTTTDYLLGLTDDPSPGEQRDPPVYGAAVWEMMRAMRPATAAGVVQAARALLAVQEDLAAEARDFMLGVATRTLDVEAQGILGEARRLAAAGDLAGAFGLIEGYVERREAEQAGKEPVNHGEVG